MFHVLEPCGQLSDRVVTVLIILGALSRMRLHKVQINDFFLWSSGLMHTVSYLVKVQTSFAGALLCLTPQAVSFIHIKPCVYLHARP